MALFASLEVVRPYLKKPLTTSEESVAQAYIEAIEVYLNARYADRINDDNSPLAYFYIARAIERGVASANSNPLVATESFSDASVTYSAITAKGELFLPAELVTLDSVFGRGGLRVIRFGSRR